MQFLDEKARLFGKINIIDLALIILSAFFILFIIIFMQFYKYPKPIINSINPSSAYFEEQAKIQITGKNFSKNSIVYLGDNKVSSINFINDGILEITIPPGLSPAKYEVKVANRNKVGILADGLTIKPFVVAKLLKVKVKFSNLPFELSENLKEGTIIKDKSDKMIVKITKIISKTTSKIMVFVGSYKLFDDPVRKDVVALTEILAEEKDSAYYYQNQIVKINNPIKFSTQLFEIKGLIVDIEK